MNYENYSKLDLISKILKLESEKNAFNVSLTKQIEINNFYRKNLDTNDIALKWIEDNIKELPIYIRIHHYSDSKYSYTEKEIKDKRMIFELSKSYCLEIQVELISKEQFESIF